MRNQFKEIPFGLCAVERSVFALLGGTVSEGREASQSTAPARRGNVVSWLCCVAATHVPIQVVFPRVDFSEEKVNGMAPSQEHGPRAARSYPAALFASFFDGTRSSLDWVVSTLGIEAPQVPIQVDRFFRFHALIKSALQCDVFEEFLPAESGYGKCWRIPRFAD